MDNFKEKFNNLPEDLQYVLCSELDYALNDEICKRHGINGENVSKIIDIIVELIFKELKISDLINRIKKDFSATDNKAKQLAITVVGKRLLVFNNYFNGEAKKFIESLGKNVALFQNDVKQQEEIINQEILSRKEDIKKIEPPKPIKYVEIDEEEEKQIAIDLLNKNLVIFLDVAFNGSARDVIIDYNGILISLLAGDQNFKIALGKALFNNQEKLTYKKFILDKKACPPNIANWLKDFIKKNGSGIFNSLVLTEYLTNSENVKKLDSKEKNLLRKLLLLYRNLKFFPESMSNISPEKWEIIPIDKEVEKEKNSIKTITTSASLKSEEEKNNLLIKQSAPVILDKEIYNQQPKMDVLVKGSNFFFSPDDETEIRELIKNNNNYSNVVLPEEDLLNEMISKANIDFSSEVLAERFKNFLKIYSRDIRNRIETKQALIKSFEIGGLSFDEDLAEQTLSIVDYTLKNFNKPLEPKPIIKPVEAKFKKESVESLKNIGARDFEYDFATLVKQKDDEKANENILEKIDTTHELAPLTPSAVKAIKQVELIKKPIASTTAQPISRQKPIVEKPKLEIFQKDINARSSQIRRQQTEPDNKIKMEDIKFVPRVMSLVDEIRYLNLVNFRRLNMDQGKAIEKIKEKINLLEEENYAKRLEGINAWRSCPVSKLYLDMGHASISANKSIDVIIEERKKRKEDYLTVSEFKSIVDLNKSLRF